ITKKHNHLSLDTNESILGHKLPKSIREGTIEIGYFSILGIGSLLQVLLKFVMGEELKELLLHFGESFEQFLRVLVQALEHLETCSNAYINVRELGSVRIPTGGRLLECSLEECEVLSLGWKVGRLVECRLIAGRVSRIDEVPRRESGYEVGVLITEGIGQSCGEVVRTGVASLSGDVSEDGQGLCHLDSIHFKHGKSLEGETLLHSWPLFYLHLQPVVLQRDARDAEHHADWLATGEQIEVGQLVLRHG
ncbi:hypothetical protein PENTCL1PPCAC_8080, partial [Pristionchus entomophagus]